MAGKIWETLRRHHTDLLAMSWAITCCWLAVWGNYLMLDFGVTIFYLVPIDLFVVPVVVTGIFQLARRLT